MDIVISTTQGAGTAAPLPTVTEIDIEVLLAQPVEDFLPEPALVVEHPTWAALRAACPLRRVGTLEGLTPDVVAAMNLRRRSAGDQLVVDLLAWAPIYRNATELRRGKEVEELSGYGRSRLALGVRMYDAVEEGGGRIPPLWLGIGPDGVDLLLRAPGPTREKKVSTPRPVPVPQVVEPQAEARALRAMAARVRAAEAGPVLSADPRATSHVVSAAVSLLVSLVMRLEPGERGKTASKLAVVAEQIRLGLPPSEARVARKEIEAHRRTVEQQDPEATTLALFGGGDEPERAGSAHSDPDPDPVEQLDTWLNGLSA